jgi:hypothetical protein
MVGTTLIELLDGNEYDLVFGDHLEGSLLEHGLASIGMLVVVHLLWEYYEYHHLPISLYD